jgi:uncharacterized protein (DUF1684 family)
MNPSRDTDARAAWGEWRRQRDQFFKHHYASPLPEEAMEEFEALDYFDFDAGMAFEVTLDPKVDEAISIVSSTGSRSSYAVAGHVVIALPDGTRSLLALRGEEDDIFIPFRDGTCGAGSYGGGRYVGLVSRAEGLLTVDFNRSINPYCAYDTDFSCPLPPAQNQIEMRIEAGERDYRRRSV